MGTFIAVDAEAQTPEKALAAIESAFASAAAVERLMHPPRSGSDLAAIHESEPGMPVAVHPWTWDVLALCRQIHEASEGAFDPCLPQSAGRFSDLSLLRDGRVIARAPLKLDLGGVAKGFAVDRALSDLRMAGCTAGLVNAGGDVASFGGRGRLIACRESQGRGFLVELCNAALATSDAGCDAGCGARPAEHRGHYDGSNGREISSGFVTVSAPLAVIADALTKCVLAAPATSAALLRRFDARQIRGK